jgi:hypothetical protein
MRCDCDHFPPPVAATVTRSSYVSLGQLLLMLRVTAMRVRCPLQLIPLRESTKYGSLVPTDVHGEFTL